MNKLTHMYVSSLSCLSLPKLLSFQQAGPLQQRPGCHWLHCCSAVARSCRWSFNYKSQNLANPLHVSFCFGKTCGAMVAHFLPGKQLLDSPDQGVAPRSGTRPLNLFTSKTALQLPMTASRLTAPSSAALQQRKKQLLLTTLHRNCQPAGSLIFSVNGSSTGEGEVLLAKSDVALFRI